MASVIIRALALSALCRVAAALTLSVASSGGNATSGYQYGIMFEDISHSGDGGIYAELIQNRAFQNGTLVAWSAVGDATLALDTSSPLSSALSYSVAVTSSGNGTVDISNLGWWGISVKEENAYTGSFYSRGQFVGEFTAALVSDITNETLASAKVASNSSSDSWTKHEFQLKPSQDAANSNNSFVMTYQASAGTVLNFNLINLFPPTYKNTPNGLRPDLAQALQDLKPTYFRAPDGNNLEGNYSPDYWNWSATIGPLEERPGRVGTWGYSNSDGLGLFLDGTVTSEEDLASHVDDTLNELEFLLGDMSTTWGAVRASLGYPDPFTVKFVEVGNEDNLNSGLSSYEDYRLNLFYEAITAKYPDILVFSSTADYLYDNSGQDYHQYTRPDYFVYQFDYFDNWAGGNPIMIGEFASVQNNTGVLEGTNWDDPKNIFPFWIGAVSEAVFLIGAERNADRVCGASYAPVLQNLNSYEWTPDLISFTADPGQTILSVSYHVIKLFSNTIISETLPVTASEGFGPVYYVAGKDASSNYILKAAVYNSTGDVGLSVSFAGLSSGATAQLTVLTADGPFANNNLETPDSVIETVTEITASANGTFEFSLPDLSVALLVAS